MRMYRITAPGFVILHLMTGARDLDCILTANQRDMPLTRQQGAELLKNARSKGYRVEHVA